MGTFGSCCENDGWIDDVATDPLRDGAAISIQSWTKPTTFFTVDRSGRVAPSGLGSTSSADYSAVADVETTATSADGTRVPLSILRRRDQPADGSHPTLLYAYGGYGVSVTPTFSPTMPAWLERGGVYAVCHVRGGGEKVTVGSWTAPTSTSSTASTTSRPAASPLSTAS